MYCIRDALKRYDFDKLPILRKLFGLVHFANFMHDNSHYIGNGWTWEHTMIDCDMELMCTFETMTFWKIVMGK